MPRKAIDSRITSLIRNGIQEKKRSFFVVVGDRAKDVIVHLHHIMSSVDVKQNKSVLWAYKKDLLGFTSHRKKREAKIKKEIKRGIRDPNTEDPFELFVTLQQIRYVYYKEQTNLGTHMESLTPNLLAKTIETVEGGGLVILLLKGMKSLKQLYTLSMDVHSRYRTEAHGDVVARFNERFILSLGSCKSCLVIDDELNVLPISGGKYVEPLPPADPDNESTDSTKKELKEIKDKLADTQPIGSLVTLAKTVDQAKALLTFVDAIAEKTLRSTVALTAARGRGKSAALGVAIAAAIAYGYSNIFITSPSPENLKTLFEFVFKGFDALGYMDHVDYTILQSTNPDFNKAIVRVNVHRQHRQTIQYIQPQDAYALGQAELLVIDEAAAIPLPMVRKLMGPYLVFMASTINGYEGTGRSLSLKLIQQLREQSRGGAKSADDTDIVDRAAGKSPNHGEKFFSGGRSLREITLSEPIRYAPGDFVEKWLNKLLCLDATLPKSKVNTQGCPHPSQCELLHVNRDVLFSFHPLPEKLLQQMMALYVASHYKNSPNDLQLMSDAPAHQLFVLVPPTDPNKVPEPLCVIQVALEGRISKESVFHGLSRGQRAGGDLIPWLVNIHSMPPLFARLNERRPDALDYLGVSYGLTPPLLKFWKRSRFIPVYLRQTPNELTGEHSCVMLRTLATGSNDTSWLGAYARDFHKRFLSLLSYQFRDFPSILSLSISESANAVSKSDPSFKPSTLTKADLDKAFSPFDLKRLDSYANNLLDYHVILDMVPTIAGFYFSGCLGVNLSGIQQSILLAIGLQRKSFDDAEKELTLAASQLMAMFIKIARKVSAHFRTLVECAVVETLPVAKVGVSPNDATGVHDDEVIDDRFRPLDVGLEEELREGGQEVNRELKEKQRALIDALPLDQYEIANGAAAWEDAEKQVRSSFSKNGNVPTVSVKSSKPVKRKAVSIFLTWDDPSSWFNKNSVTTQQ
ncbi:nucleolar ATPase Kre33 [Histoplasma capsulatum H143]|uniref:RNA cytidine acetyltransferase n=1 Tax=Ajellomyces capsulatus (strain H143) TaxID=544712 RepID=C6HAG2_AJECH|nr:nucleolar ATPase Kre33 [Histoplasma capsulatum H143]